MALRVTSPCLRRMRYAQSARSATGLSFRRGNAGGSLVLQPAVARFATGRTRREFNAHHVIVGRDGRSAIERHRPPSVADLERHLRLRIQRHLCGDFADDGEELLDRHEAAMIFLWNVPELDKDFAPALVVRAAI